MVKLIETRLYLFEKKKKKVIMGYNKSRIKISFKLDKNKSYIQISKWPTSLYDWIKKFLIASLKEPVLGFFISCGRLFQSLIVLTEKDLPPSFM